MRHEKLPYQGCQEGPSEDPNMVPLKQDFAGFAQTWDIYVFFKWILDREKKNTKNCWQAEK